MKEKTFVRRKPFMRLIVMFDIPTVTKEEKRTYILFRRFLLDNGYYMLQYSIYVKLCSGHDDVARRIEDLKINAPVIGSVRAISLTEKQYQSMEYLVGFLTPEEETSSDEKMIQLTLF